MHGLANQWTKSISWRSPAQLKEPNFALHFGQHSVLARVPTMTGPIHSIGSMKREVQVWATVLKVLLAPERGVGRLRDTPTASGVADERGPSLLCHLNDSCPIPSSCCSTLPSVNKGLL